MSYQHSLGILGLGTGGADYADIRSGGDYEKFSQLNFVPGEIYTFRFIGSPPSEDFPNVTKSFQKSYPLLQAFIASLPDGNQNFDVLGITISFATGKSFMYEIVYRCSDSKLHLNTDSPGTTLEKMQAWLAANGKPYSLIDPAYAYINEKTRLGSKAVAFWRSRPPIWSYTRLVQGGKAQNFQSGYPAGFTDEASKGMGVFLGQARNETKQELSPVPTSPLVDGSSPWLATDSESGAGVGTLVLLGIAAAGGFYLWRSRSR